CIPIKAQNVNVRVALLSRAVRLRHPDFQLSVFERQSFANSAACIDWRCGRKQNQMVRQMTEKHDREIYAPDCEQPPGRWKDSQPHICLDGCKSFRPRNSIKQSFVWKRCMPIFWSSRCMSARNAEVRAFPRWANEHHERRACLRTDPHAKSRNRSVL